MGFVNEEVHLLRNPFAADPKQPNLPGNQKVERTWLERVTRQVNLLLCEVKAVSHRSLTDTGSAGSQLADLQPAEKRPSPASPSCCKGSSHP